MGNMDLLNLHQPWDCQRFPKSKSICYGGGGGGGGNPISKAIESASDVVSEATPDIKMPTSIADTSLAPIADAGTGLTENIKTLGTNIADTVSEAKLPEIAPIKMPTSIADTSLGGIDLSMKGLEEGIKKKGSMISEGWEQKKASAQNIKEDISEGIEKKKTAFGEGWENTKKRAKDTWERSDLGKGLGDVQDFIENPAKQLGLGDSGGGLPDLSGMLPGGEEPGEPKGKGTATGTGLSDLQKSQLAKRRQGYGRRQTFLT
jgi:hypothetical protein